MNTTIINILIAENDPLIQIGLKAYIERNPSLNLIGLTDNGKKLIEMSLTYLPDIVILDLINLNEKNGLEVIKTLKELLPSLPVLVLSSYQDNTTISLALSAGANGYCLKGINSERLTLAIKSVCQGGLWLDYKINPFYKTEKQTYFQYECNLKEKSLNQTESNVLLKVEEGLSNKEIAIATNTSENNIKGTLNRIKKKLKVHTATRFDLVDIAKKKGLLKPQHKNLENFNAYINKIG
ncbi:response regulator transcription factor [Chroococcus sp. FPU101]|uniref:response regulator transcription factor n=1 Tax=Chroococcus sp. FPU101 TaxID=1974212 RepID=UPI001A8DEBA7|nr:response regulator transcription factor [Chroococcus sp. FPU101]GFE69071.1 two component transcriptional regulator, LuxR family [Chroococcus sp. FPU101]